MGNVRGRWARGGTVGLFGITAASLLVSVSHHAAAYAPIDLSAGAVLCLIALVSSLLIITADSQPSLSPARIRPWASSSAPGRLAYWI